MEVEKEVKKMTLGHDFGAGAACLKCKDKCEGFELHFWRKICRNCKCDLTDHNVQMKFEENKKVGKLFEDTKYTSLIAKLKTDGIPTHNSNMVTISIASLATATIVPPTALASSVPVSVGINAVPISANAMPANITAVRASAVPVTANAVSVSMVPVKKDVPMMSITYEWVPSAANQSLAVHYIELLPPEKRPVAGTEGAVYRRQQMARQLPEHDQDPEMCHELSPGEVKQMQQFVRKYKDEALGVGDICLPEKMPLRRLGTGGGGIRAGVGEHEVAAGLGDKAGAGHGIVPGGAGVEKRQGVVGLGSILAGQPCRATRPEGGSVIGFVEGAGPEWAGSTGAAGAGVPGVGGLGVLGTRVVAGKGWSGKLETDNKNGTIGISGGLSAYTSEFTGHTFSCHQCQLPMQEGQPAVYAERAGYDRLWHPACFVCSTCGELLVDMIYFWKKDKLFCGRHYGDSEKPRCGGCDELIFSNEYTQAEGQNWHLKHFCCFDCDSILAGETYVMENNKPICKPCYMKSHAVRCMACQNPVEPEAQRVSYSDHHWHAEPDCFQCSCCSKCLIGQRFMAMQGMLFCSVECKKKTLS